MNTVKHNKLKSLVSVTAVSAMTLMSSWSVVMADESDWPAGTVKVIMHTKAGGSSDVFMRTLAKSLEPKIGQSVVVVNSPGGAGASQMSRISSSNPDGLTLGVNTLTHFTGMLTNLKGVFSVDDFSWIASAQVDPNLIWTRSGSEIRDLDDLVSRAKENDGEVTVGGFGPVGSTQYIALSMLEQAAGVDFEWVAFNSTPDIVAAVLGEHVDVGMSNLSGAQSYFEADRVQGLGVLGEERLDGLPDVPTFGEQGYDVDTSWVQVRGVFGPAGIPMDVQQDIADAFHEAMRTEQYQEYARNAGVTDSWMGPQEYTEFVNRISNVAEQQLEAAGVTE